jgi:hypothetical protein
MKIFKVLIFTNFTVLAPQHLFSCSSLKVRWLSTSAARSSRYYWLSRLWRFVAVDLRLGERSGLAWRLFRRYLLLLLLYLAYLNILNVCIL